ncbi:MAG: sulfite exporter TauE/SafE family protein [Vicinamibacterales bacterium]
MTVLLLVAGVIAGVQNALAGGGSFVTLGMLVIAGLDPRAANITSTIALFPGQVATGYAGRGLASGTPRLSFRALFGISLAGGVLGACLLLATPPTFFAGLVPWLVLFATGVFVWGSFLRRPAPGAAPSGPGAAAASQFLIAIYGGYFGGGIGFLMLAALTVAGLSVRPASATKNVLAATMNASAVLIFLFSRDVHWPQAAVLGIGAVLGGLIGTVLLTRVNERGLRIGVIVLGAALSVGLFARGH